MARPSIDMSVALKDPSREAMRSVLDLRCSDGRMWKLGSCFEDLLDTRPFSTTHYNRTYFEPELGAFCLASNITTKEEAAMLESFGIQHLKAIGVGVNVRSTDDVPHEA